MVWIPFFLQTEAILATGRIRPHTFDASVTTAIEVLERIFEAKSKRMSFSFPEASKTL
jgi:hypothetical protein